MNVLIVNDDGPGAAGLKVLQEAARQHYRGTSAFIMTLTPKSASRALSMSVRTTPGQFETLTRDNLDIVEKDEYTFDGTPADCVLLAFHRMDLFLSMERPTTWDLVLAGINHGQNLGFDIHHSGTVGQAMIAATAFGTAAWAFSQQLGPDFDDPSTADRKAFRTADRTIVHTMQTYTPQRGEALNTNFPAGDPRGHKQVPVAHYSNWLPPKSSLVPRAKGEVSDVTEFTAGFITTSRLILRVGSPIRF